MIIFHHRDYDQINKDNEYKKVREKLFFWNLYNWKLQAKKRKREENIDHIT